MAITKRVRFEVLRRDNYQCQYCGLRAPETAEGLTIDHVIPVALGGLDDPSNLVAACRDCNAGKTSIQPDSPLVSSVSSRSLEWAMASANRNAQIEADFRAMEQYEEEFLSAWGGWTYRKGITETKLPLPNDWRGTLKRWWGMSVPAVLLESAVTTAMTAQNVAADDTFRYFCGVVWRTLDQYDSASSQATNQGRVYGPDEMESLKVKEYDLGRRMGKYVAAKWIHEGDLLRHHIDGTSPREDFDWVHYGELILGAA